MLRAATAAWSFALRHASSLIRLPPKRLCGKEQQSPAALAAYHKAEIEKWWPIIKAANIKAE